MVLCVFAKVCFNSAFNDKTYSCSYQLKSGGCKKWHRGKQLQIGPNMSRNSTMRVRDTINLYSTFDIDELG